MATISITSNDGALDSASAVLEVTATNPEYNQPALRIQQAGKRGGATSIRIDNPNPDKSPQSRCWPPERLRNHCRIYATGSGWQYRFRIPGSPLQKVWQRKGC